MAEKAQHTREYVSILKTIFTPKSAKDSYFHEGADLLHAHVLGKAAEDAALQHLLTQGLKLLRRNYRCRMGEIDLIMLDQKVIVFVEVRYRKASQFGQSLETVGAAKRHKLYKAAQHYLLYHPRYQNFVCRFDVVAITLVSKQQIELTWIENAFTHIGA